MHRTVAIALSLFGFACMPAKPNVTPAPAADASATCSQERAAAVIYLVDGVPAPCTAAMSLPTERIASVEVVKGPAAAAYGAAAGTGVVIIQTRRDR